jgi:aminopeptidase YwaD
MIRSFFLLTLLFSFEIQSQTPNFSKYVDTLCSNYFMGRGYVNDGHLKTANFLEEKFNEINLAPLNNDRFTQDFNINVNTFPDSLELKLDGKPLFPGIDFMISPQSSGLKGTFNVVKVDLNNWNSILKNNKVNQSIVSLNVSKILNRDTISMYKELRNILNKSFPVLWISSEKLQWSVADYVSNFPMIKIASKSVNYDFSTVQLNIENKFKTALRTQNVIGQAVGKRKKSIIISAHYDHLGMMGQVKFPGANDNASGVSLLLNLASYYSITPHKYNIIFICFGAEEAGLKGSKYFTEHPLLDLKKVKFLINIDIVGTGEEGIAIVNALEENKAAKKIGKINTSLNYFKKIKIRGQSPNSDHYWFSHHQVPSIFIYTMGGIQAYHDPLDKSETLPLNKIEDLYHLIIDFVNGF